MQLKRGGENVARPEATNRNVAYMRCFTLAGLKISIKISQYILFLSKHIWNFHLGVVVIFSLNSTPVMNRLFWTPFGTGKTHLTMMLPNRLVFNHFYILDRANLCADRTAITFIISVNTFIRQWHQFIIFEICIFWFFWTFL